MHKAASDHFGVRLDSQAAAQKIAQLGFGWFRQVITSIRPLYPSQISLPVGCIQWKELSWRHFVLLATHCLRKPHRTRGPPGGLRVTAQTAEPRESLGVSHGNLMAEAYTTRSSDQTTSPAGRCWGRPCLHRLPVLKGLRHILLNHGDQQCDQAADIDEGGQRVQNGQGWGRSHRRLKPDVQSPVEFWKKQTFPTGKPTRASPKCAEVHHRNQSFHRAQGTKGSQRSHCSGRRSTTQTLPGSWPVSRSERNKGLSMNRSSARGRPRPLWAIPAGGGGTKAPRRQAATKSLLFGRFC